MRWKNRNLAFLIILGLIITGSLIIYLGNSKEVEEYKQCLETWPDEWANSIISNYRLTKEDFCEKGYTLSSFLTLTKDLAMEIVLDGNYADDDIDLITIELKNKVREIIKPN